MSLSAGKRFGSYEIVELIGVGGMSEVYRARDSRLERDVALKLLPDARRLDAEMPCRLRGRLRLRSTRLTSAESCTAT